MYEHIAVILTIAFLRQFPNILLRGILLALASTYFQIFIRHHSVPPSKTVLLTSHGSARFQYTYVILPYQIISLQMNTYTIEYTRVLTRFLLFLD